MTPSPLLQSLGRLPALIQAKLRTESQRLLGEHRLRLYKPYPKQLEFHAAGGDNRERLLLAANQVGKTIAGGYELAIHLTGMYPEWWRGKVFEKPIVSWAAGETSEAVRDSVQLILMGDISHIGTGSIPKASIKDYSLKRGVADAIDTVFVRHGGGGDVQAGESRITFKSYDQGRTKFQAATLDYVWLDEEPNVDIYMEALTRTNASNGCVALTFTPNLGYSQVVERYLLETHRGTHVTSMTVYDALHYSPERCLEIIESYPEHERDARAFGLPRLGSGAVFPVSEALITIDPIELPGHWPRIRGVDFGYDHPFAWVSLAWDRDTDTVYLYDEYRRDGTTPKDHVADLRTKPDFDWIPTAWPHDGLQHDKQSGIPTADAYRDLGMNLLLEKFSNPPTLGEDEGTGGNGVEVGAIAMLTRMQTGRWKVFSTCQMWLGEFRQLHRKDGKIVKIKDDLISASRYASMSLRFAETKPVAFRPQRMAQGARNW